MTVEEYEKAVEAIWAKVDKSDPVAVKTCEVFIQYLWDKLKESN